MRDCPVCQATLPVHDGYVTWCDQCGWNVHPQQVQARNIFEAMYLRLGQKQSRALLEHYRRAEALRPSLSLSKLLALLFAGAIHVTTLTFAIGGGLMFFLDWPNLVAITGGILCVGIAWVIRPRFGRLPDPIVSRVESPVLYSFVDIVSDSLGAPRVSGIVVNERFNAGFAKLGWRRKGILFLGLPLWSILAGQEKVALVAHELAHSINGDSTRSFFVGSAVNSLAQWYGLLHPRIIWDPATGPGGLALIPFNLVKLALARLAWLGAYILAHLLWRDSQRAEYLADALGASTGGTEAMLSLLDKLHFGSSFVTTLRSVALGRDTTRDYYQEFQQRVATVPERELERVRRVQEMEYSRLDATHPPTTYRIELLRSHYVSHPRVEFSKTDLEQVEEELLPLRGQLQRKLVDAYKATI